ncbi:bifunctional 4-hydroxy-2-oxoglutarate aldolase/2-dehydro-3-deoxy-phosphogluconate aldolase [Changpingibacter yushuensis]|uniref:bifunctional 4-hydroxy-2-oxoglutarate aldolase/2-dehydro-3-deoxy-phosphogluconate aldolase n=1 Tax=Changpingibacter yushuensis TaxID=2758440 RepID=UPI0029350E2A|nr:bifunctional 4-hydroxy-2-oxoglutarate aldolase/2-dehydro-3-deoxy-phosphogluconate aldolase [Changpingibacter yushuensis]
MAEVTTDIHAEARNLCAANPIIPVVVIDDPAHAVEAGKALLAGGIACAELTFRTAAAAEVIKEMVAVEGLTVGAGTVVNVEQARRALDAGATFLVSPGFSAAVAQFASDESIPYMPGTVTASEITAALDYGFETLKFFPAVASGGLPVVKALSAPFPQVKFVATGGIGTKNIAEWITNPAIASVGGSWMISRDDVANQRWDQITKLSTEAVALVEEARK